MWLWKVPRQNYCHDACQTSKRSNEYKPISRWFEILWDVSNHQPHDCLLNLLFRRRSKKTPKLRVTGLCGGNSPVTGEFPTQMASNAENGSIWWEAQGLYRLNQIPYYLWIFPLREAVDIFHDDIFRVTGLLCREFTGHRWISRTKASDAELWYFLWSALE